MKEDRFFIKPTSQDARVELINYLEEQGFAYVHHAIRANTIESRFPVVVDAKEKTIDCMGSVTVSACAASCNALISEEEFYQQFPERRMRGTGFAAPAIGTVVPKDHKYSKKRRWSHRSRAAR